MVYVRYFQETMPTRSCSLVSVCCYGLCQVLSGGNDYQVLVVSVSVLLWFMSGTFRRQCLPGPARWCQCVAMVYVRYCQEVMTTRSWSLVSVCCYGLCQVLSGDNAYQVLLVGVSVLLWFMSGTVRR